ncbi:hypothetical protein BDR06DRAFT_49414 [Suillus hirtellus]|nr:hypothetical protein BDR06DRAFT_49414 [Suillus hirtellus]
MHSKARRCSSSGSAGFEWEATSYFCSSIRRKFVMRRTHSMFISTSCLAWGFLSPAYRTVVFTVEQNHKKTLLYALLNPFMCCTGCVVNDILDRDFDCKVGTSWFYPANDCR